MEEKQITLSGCYGAGTNHLRLLLGLVPGKKYEILVEECCLMIKNYTFALIFNITTI